jgi:hypothetical protein
MARNMGMTFGNRAWKKKNRWRFVVRDFIDMEDFGISMLPPIKSARPNVNFKEISIEHVVETITIPGKPDWGPLEVTLYDLQCNRNPMFVWMKRLYDPKNGTYRFPVDGERGFKIPQADLELLSGCGDVLETWRYEGIWPQKIDWGELLMESSEVITVDVSFRYDRAYFVEG